MFTLSERDEEPGHVARHVVILNMALLRYPQQLPSNITVSSSPPCRLEVVLDFVWRTRL